MKAVVHTEYGPPHVLHMTDVPKPTPKAHEILIKVRATSVSFGDLIVRRFGQVSPREFNMPLPMWLLGRLSFGFRRPKYGILGHEFAGEVDAVGDAVQRFKVGDRVFGFLGDSMGANAEYATIPEDKAVDLMPANVSFEEAAAVPYGAFIALNLLRKAKPRPGEKVLILGASGGIGSAALQLIKNHGAQVTAVAGTPRVGFVRALGADHVIDYSVEDFTRNGETYDLIFDVLGRSSFARCRRSLTPNGRYFLVSFKAGHLLDMLWTSIGSRKKVICGLAVPERMEDLHDVKALIEAGVLKAVIDRRFPLEQTAEAHRYIEGGHKKGHIVITIGGNGKVLPHLRDSGILDGEQPPVDHDKGVWE
jgi:NADPH:quinone reductase-like Zn-dependent oxidoreductase